MAKRNENIVTVIDLGSAKTVALVVEITDAGLRYRGHGIADSSGSRRGVVVDLEKATKSVSEAVVQAERAAELALDSAVVGISGPHIRAVNSQGGINLGARPREISREDMRAAVEKARAIPLPEDRQILHLLPQEFLLDDQDGIRDAFGMLGRQLEVRLHVVTASQSSTQNVVTALNRAGMHVDDTVFEALASSDSVLRSDERELGAAVIDIGAQTTDVVVVQEGVIIHSAVVPLGGDNFTRDIALCLETPLMEAETIKKQFGYAIVTRIPEANEIEVPSVGDRPSRMMSQRSLGEILEPRARELMHLVRENLRQAGVLDVLGGGIILTGGGARLGGMLETCEDMLRRPTRLGIPVGLSRLPATLQEPEFATAIGMVFYAQRARVLRGRDEQRLSSRLKSLFARTGLGL